jgi:hypothetical protein
MSRVSRASRLLAATALIAVVAGCSPTTPSPSEPAPTNVAVAPSRSAAVATPAVAPARWTDCGEGFLCADVRVPRAYAAPSGGYMDISVLEMPATDRSQRIGSLVIDPGGPGASGVDFVR